MRHGFDNIVDWTGSEGAGLARRAQVLTQLSGRRQPSEVCTQWEGSDDLHKAEMETLNPTLATYTNMRRAGLEIQVHNLLPQEFREWFIGRGITNIDAPWLLYPIGPGRHRDIHGRGGGTMWENSWNMRWRQFIRDNQYASPHEIIRFLTKLMKEFGL